MKMLQELMSESKAIIAAFTETHLSSSVLDAEAQIEGYQLYRSDRDGRQGGVAIYVVNDASAEVDLVSKGSNGVVEHLFLHIKKYNMLFILIYRPPSAVFDDFSPVMRSIREKILSFGDPSPTLVVCGDFNMPHMTWEAETDGVGGAGRQSSLVAELRDDFFLSQVVNTPTREGNILDLFFVNNEEIIMSVQVVKTIMSDHCIITVDTMLGYPNSNHFDAPPEEGLHSLNFYSDRVNWEDVTLELASVDWGGAFHDKDVEEMYSFFLEKIHSVSLLHVPKKKRRNPKKIPRDRRILMRKRSGLKKRLQRARESNRRDIESQIAAIEERISESHLNELKRNEEKAIEAIRSNSKFFFKYAKQKAETRTEIGPLRRGSELVCEPSEMSEILRRQYESVFSTPRPDYGPDDEADSDQQAEERMEDIILSPMDFIEVSSNIRTNSASGPDGITAILLKRTISALAIPLCIMWQESLRTGRIPEKLKVGKITPIFKGGDKPDPKNYRPVALTSHLVKIFEKIVVKRLGQFLEGAELLNENQHGFRSGRSCLSQLLLHHQDILENLTEGLDVDVVYLDFSKAFDKVDHAILCRKLRQLGVGGVLLRWIREFLTNRVQFVAVDGAFSQNSAVISGVPQGSVLGPVLFLIHIGDINQHVQYSTVRSFADDTRIIMPIKTETDCMNLQTDLNVLYDWAVSNNMVFNGEKFDLLRYVVSGAAVDFVYETNDRRPIDTKERVTDLGVMMSDSLKFDDHIQEVSTRGRQRVGWMLRVFQTRERVALMTLYRSLVLPILEYCCQLWSPHTVGMMRTLEAVQRTFTYRIRDLSELNYWERLRELRLYSLERRRERYAIIYVWKVLQELVPNFEERVRLRSYVNERRGRLCRIPPMDSRAMARLQTIREASLPVAGPRLFNCLPQEVRNYEGTLEGFKGRLDAFLSTLPDTPKLPNYHQQAQSNSILRQVEQLRLN